MNHSDIFIFTGPTIAVDHARKHLEATYLPPVKYGDVYRITELYQPKIIGIIDGYFNQVPAVWHKEILWALDQGVMIFGASSMGALRAAELDQLGMIGCGKIYQAYQTSVLPPFIDESLEDDDEVAVVHGPAELGYKQYSEAMINIRFTLANAQQQNVINPDEVKVLVKIAKSLFYPNRDYSKIFKLAQTQEFDTAKLDELRAWLEKNKVDQKQLDAIAMLKEIKNQITTKPSKSASNYPTFQHTSQWQTAIKEIDEAHHLENPALTEIRLTGEQYFDLLDEALSSNLVSRIQQAQHDFDLNLLHQSPDELDQAFSSHWQIKQAQSTANRLTAFQVDQLLLNYLDKKGRLQEFTERAENKGHKLNQMENQPTIHDLNELELLQLCDWYFTQRLNFGLPDVIEDYVNQLGLTDVDEFYDMILKEYYYLEIISRDGSSTQT